jgi:hypothetical protein
MQSCTALQRVALGIVRNNLLAGTALGKGTCAWAAGRAWFSAGASGSSAGSSDRASGSPQSANSSTPGSSPSSSQPSLHITVEPLGDAYEVGTTS